MEAPRLLVSGVPSPVLRLVHKTHTVSTLLSREHGSAKQNTHTAVGVSEGTGAARAAPEAGTVGRTDKVGLAYNSYKINMHVY